MEVGAVGVYKSVSNVMGLHIGCSPVVPSTTTTAVAGEPIPIMHPPLLTPAISVDDGNDARCMTHDHAMTGTHSPGRPPSTTDHANRPQQRQRQRQ